MQNLQRVLSYNTPFTVHIQKIAARGGGILKYDLDKWSPLTDLCKGSAHLWLPLSKHNLFS